MKLVPMRDRLVLKQLEAEETTATGIILPADAQEKPKQAEVIAVGSEIKDVKPADIVIYKSYGPDDVKVDGTEYLVAKEEDILAKVEGAVKTAGKSAKGGKK